MHKWNVLKTILKFTLKLTFKLLWHVSVQSHHHQGAHCSEIDSTSERCNVHTPTRTL
jgi:hypothetical protein